MDTRKWGENEFLGADELLSPLLSDILKESMETVSLKGKDDINLAPKTESTLRLKRLMEDDRSNFVSKLAKAFSSDPAIKTMLPLMDQLDSSPAIIGAIIDSQLEEISNVVYRESEKQELIEKLQASVEQKQKQIDDLLELEVDYTNRITELTEAQNWLFSSPEGAQQLVEKVSSALLTEITTASTAKELKSESDKANLPLSLSSSVTPAELEKISLDSDLAPICTILPLSTTLFTLLTTPSFLDKGSPPSEGPNVIICRWLMIASFLAAQFPWWKSRFSYIMQRMINNCNKVPEAGSLMQSLLPGSFTQAYVLRMENKSLNNQAQHMPVFNLKRFL